MIKIHLSKYFVRALYTVYLRLNYIARVDIEKPEYILNEWIRALKKNAL